MQTPEAKTEERKSPLTKGFRTELDLLERHIRMLQFVEEHGPIGIIRLSSLLAVPKHKVRYSLRILEKEGYIRPSTAGAVTTEKVSKLFEEIQRLLHQVKGESDNILASLQRPR